MIHAYKTATSWALQLTPQIQKAVELSYEINFDYHQINEVMMILKQYNCSVVSQSAQLFVSLKVGIPTLRLDEVMNKLNELKGVSYSTTLVV